MLVGLAPLFVVVAYIFFSQRAVLLETADQNLRSHAELEADAVGHILRQTEENLRVLASNPVLRSPDASSEELLEQLTSFTVFEDVTMLDPAGNVIESATYSFSGNWRANAVFREAREGRPGISDVRYLPDLDKYVVEFAAPVIDGDETVAVVVGRMNMERVWKLLGAVKIGESGFIVALDRNGNFIAHPDKELVLTKPETYQESPASAGVTPLRLRGVEGENFVGQMAPVGILGWEIAALQNEAETYSLVNDTIQIVLLMIAIVAAATIGVALLLSRAIARPLAAVGAGMRKIAGGSFKERLQRAELQEVDELSTSFNTMAGELENRTSELTKEVAERKRAEEQVRYWAYHDSLTNLPNRELFRDRLNVALAQARRSGQMLAVMFLDLDQFKIVNDTVGHAAGDRLLQIVTERLVGLLREGDSLARVGGDEFTLLLPQIQSVDDAIGVARRVLAGIRSRHVLAGHEFRVSTSMGIAIFPGAGEDAESLLRNADTAMYRAKDEGRDTFQLFESSMNAYLVERVALEMDLRAAIEREELALYYQPQVNIDTGRVVGVEALVRWPHPDRGLVAPLEFIPIAEDTGLILHLGKWVLRTACAQSKGWQEAGLPPLRMAVNLSARQFRQSDLPEMIAEILEETGLDPQLLELEITEGTAMRDVEFTTATLSRLKGMGVHVSIDDFGTGYSSLGYLRQFPVDELKIDRSFIDDLPSDPDDSAIVATIIGLARTLNLRVVAEGVETEEQLAFLKGQQCEEMQGYLFSRPVPAEELEKILSRSPGSVRLLQPEGSQPG